MKTISYWLITAILAFFIGSGGVAYLLAADFTTAGFVILGLPVYIMQLIGFWKLVGAIVLLLPRLPRVKEWAYAGIFIDVTGAAVAHAAVGDYGVYAFHIVVNLLFVVLLALSWALRPGARIWGEITQF
jgi:hypothetical protein